MIGSGFGNQTSSNKQTVMRRAVVAAIVVLVYAVAQAEELWVVKDGVLNREAIKWQSAEVLKHPFWNSWIECAGETVDGLFVVPMTVDGKNNHSRFVANKSAVGDCEFTAVFSYQGSKSPAQFPNICIGSRGCLRFSADGKEARMVLAKVPVPIEFFNAACPTSVYDGNLHTIVVKRVGDKLSFHCDGEQLNEQTIDPQANLHIWFDSLSAATKIKTCHLTAEKLIDRLEPGYKSAAPVEELFVGTGGPSREYGKAAAYRIPALAVSTKGTILAFAEARRLDGRDVGDIDAVVRRSEDGGKTWGPEIVVWDDGGNSINNPCPVVDPKNGRIWICMGRFNPYPTANQHVSYSDDDGKTWSKPREITQDIQATLEPKKKCWVPGPGAGLVMRHEKYAGRLVIPMGFAPLVVYSDDHGETWKGGGWGGSDGGEAKCAELLDGSLLFNGRTGTKKRALSIVTEGGTKNATKTWYADDLPDPSCQGAIIRHSWPKDPPSPDSGPASGKPGLLLYSGPASLTSRAQGTLFGSYNNGKTWPWQMLYYEGPSGYSDITVLKDGRVAVLFEKDGKSKLGFMIVPAPPAAPKQ